MKKSLNILLIEDDVVEVMKFNRVVKSLNTLHKVVEVSSKDEALNALKNNYVHPDIIVMHTHFKNAEEKSFLSFKNQDASLRFIPAIVLSTVDSSKEVVDYYHQNLFGYLTIPLRYEEYKDKVKRMLDYWCINEFVSHYA